MSGNFTLSGDLTQTGDYTLTGAASVSGNLTVDTNTLFVDATNNRVGVGTASPSQSFQVTNGNIFLDGTDQFIYLSSDADQWISANSAANYLRLGAGNQERMRLDSSGNLLCGSDGGGDIGSSTKRFKDLYLSGGAYIGGTTSANLLDDYEEGTFTPVWTPASGSGQTISIAVGVYTKIGNRCYFDITIATNGHGTASGNVTITGLPFTATSATNVFGSAYVGQVSNASITAGHSATAAISYASTTLNPLLWDATTGTTALQVSEFGVSGSWRFCGSYQTA